MLAMSLVLSACSEEELAAAAATGPSEKNLFSSWVLQGTTLTINLTNATFNTPFAFNLYLTGGGACECLMMFSGSQSSGTVMLASCLYNSHGTGGADPGCAGLNSSSTYTKTADTLTICTPGDPCEVYK